MMEARAGGATGEELLRVGHAVAAREGLLTPPPFQRGGAGGGGDDYPFPAAAAGGGMFGAPRGGAGARASEGSLGSLAIGLMLGTFFGVIALFFTLGNSYSRLFRVGVIVGVVFNMVVSIWSDVSDRGAGGGGAGGSGGSGGGGGPHWPAPGDSPWAAAVGPPLPPK